MPKNKLLVTGASGFLGWNLCQIARTNWEIVGTTFSHPATLSGVKLVQANLRDFQALKTLFLEVKPDAVMHLAAQSKPNYCQTHPEESYAINVTASANIAGLCAEAKIPCVFTSTDLVFDGLNPPYTETDPVCPQNIYGEQKVLAERKMLEIYPATTICRMPLMFGLPSPTANSFIQGFIRALKEGKAIDLFTDEYRTSVSASTAVKGLFIALEKTQGIIHLGGRERMSRYQFGRLMAEVLDLPSELITACRQQDVVMAASRPPDTSLDSSKAFALGYQPLSMREELARLAVALLKES